MPLPQTTVVITKLPLPPSTPMYKANPQPPQLRATTYNRREQIHPTILLTCLSPRLSLQQSSALAGAPRSLLTPGHKPQNDRWET